MRKKNESSNKHIYIFFYIKKGREKKYNKILQNIFEEDDDICTKCLEKY